MALTVVVRSGEASTPSTITFDSPRIVIGRGDGCEVRLPDPSVSHRHASIRQRGNDYVVVDEGSSNGTFVGPVRLSPQAPRVLRPTDYVRVGRVWLEIRVEQAMPTQNPQATTRELALALVAGALSAQGEPVSARVTVESGPDQGRELEISDFAKSYVIGRAPDSDLPITDNDASRRHVELARRGQHVCVKELGSKNGSELDGHRLEPGKETQLESAADETMAPDESVEPPPVASDPEVPAVQPASARNRAAPLAEVPERSAPVETKRTGRGRTVDVVVALFGLLVLTLSLLGLSWVLRSH
jgi:pSer/pThr/pTyr-binding forkhead associated (FHA) protein